jgi:hypothetical protein
MALALSILALLATFYQLYLQRIRNEKSVKPLLQINLTDHNGLIYVHVQNNGLGPVIIERLIFLKDGLPHNDIKNCLEFDSKQYQHVTINESVKKVIPHGTYMEVFSKQFESNFTKDEIDNIRRQLAALQLEVEGRDIYDHKISAKRDLSWFVRHH